MHLTCKLKAYWKTTREWSDADIKNYHAAVAKLAEDARTSGRKFTCEDFALEMRCQFASKNGLPVKPTDGVREYRNMDIYDPDYHENYPRTPRGFINMVMATFGAPDIQRARINTVRRGSASALEAGDVLALALALDAKGRASNNTAHHIQVVVRKTDATIFDISRKFGLDDPQADHMVQQIVEAELGQFRAICLRGDDA